MMARCGVALMAVCILLAASGAGASPATDCVQPARRTADEMAACLHGVGEAADRRLNETYARAMASLDPASQGGLREAQRRWVAYREASVASHEGPWRQGRNLSLRIALTVATIEAIDARERELRLYLPE